MPTVIVCGQPASGKSTVAAQLQAAFEGAGLGTHVIDEASLHLDRATAYQDVPSEKDTRSAIRSAVERHVSKRTVLILDSLNNIKGYRYELWCIARAAGDRWCMVHVDTPEGTCRAWNVERPVESQYPAEALEDLLGRFETPIATNRWDSPLYTLRPAEGPVDEGVAAVVAAVTAPEGERSDCKAHGVARVVGKSQATTGKAQSGTNVMHDVDKAAQAVITAIISAQEAAAGSAAGEVAVGGHRLNVPRTVSLPELRRHKRTFLKLATKTTFSKVMEPPEITRLFVDYLRDQLHA